MTTRPFLKTWIDCELPIRMACGMPVALCWSVPCLASTAGRMIHSRLPRQDLARIQLTMKRKTLVELLQADQGPVRPRGILDQLAMVSVSVSVSAFQFSHLADAQHLDAQHRLL